MISFLTSVLALLAISFSGASAATVQQQSDANDLTVLGYALTLEHLESAFYNAGLAMYNNATSYTLAGYPNTTLYFLQMIQAHEAQHVVFITNVMNGASANSAPPACTYNFTGALTSIQQFISTAAVLENEGQTAYDGALNGITNPTYAQAAATIATVEARHAAYLNELNNAVPFPAAFDTANTPTSVLNTVLATGFIVSCPYNITLPTVRPTGVALGSNNQVTQTGSLSPSYTAAQQQNDINVLNYALTLEHLEAAFYNYAIATFPNASFTAAGVPSYYYTYTTFIQGHENTHVTTLTQVINGRQAGAAVPVCNYSFSGITTVQQYLATAQVLENTGVMAYDGAANLITDTSLQQVAATIATVEARHAAFLNQANGASPFPNNMDTATSPQAIITAVLNTGLVTGCPYTIQYPSYMSPIPNSASTSAGSFASVMAALVVAVLLVLSL